MTGLGDMTMAEDHIRYSFSQHLDRMRERYLTTIPLVYLSGGLPRKFMKQPKRLSIPFTKQIREKIMKN